LLDIGTNPRTESVGRHQIVANLIGADGFTSYIQVHCISFPCDQMMAMTALVSGGVFERLPRLRVAFLGADAGWAGLNAQHATD
jgi:hypothetical protein